MSLTLALALALGAASPPADPAVRARRQLESPDIAVQKRGAGTLLALARRHPKRFDALEGGARALFLRAGWAPRRDASAHIALRCWNAADAIIRQWPTRAEGYYWAAMCIGRYAASKDVGTALSEGLAPKLEGMAQAAIERDPSLYGRGAQRLLGCYFIRSPWPIRDYTKARRYLDDARRGDPDDANGLLCLAEVHLAEDELEQARELLARCAAVRTRDPGISAECARRLED